MKFSLGDLVQDSRNLMEWGDAQGQRLLVPRVGTIVEYDGELHRYRVMWSSKRTGVMVGALLRVGE
jgi:hypothetical protein